MHLLEAAGDGVLEMSEDAETTEGEWGLVLPFTSDDPVFTLGFEVGKLYSEMRSGERVIDGMYHTANDEQILLMAKRLGYHANWNPINEHWFGSVFTRER